MQGIPIIKGDYQPAQIIVLKIRQKSNYYGTKIDSFYSTQ